MLTNEKILAAFEEYLAADKVCEVVLTSRGYTVMEWNELRREWYNVQLCDTPEALRDALLATYRDYLTDQYTRDEQDDPTPAQQEEIRQKCEKMMELCK